jgi:beta-lactam-binding protein with PASTA domain
MPDLRYETLREVGLDLSQQKLTLGKTKTVANDDVQAGGIVSQDPPPGSSVRVGTVVNLEVSAGPPSAVKSPSFVDMDIDAARDLATRARVHLGQVVWTPFGFYGPERGRVVRQRPPAGTVLSPDERVSLQVSAGPRESGYLVRQVHARASVPSTSDVARVRLEVHDDTGTWNLFDGFAHAREKFDFDVTVIGTAELNMYINNELVSSNKLGVEPPQQEDQSKRPRPAPTTKP